MRFLAVAFLLAASCALASAGLADSQPTLSAFQRRPTLSAEELKAFAQPFPCGGVMQVLAYGHREVTLVMRSYTSGVRSSDLHVFTRTREGRYFEVLSRTPIWGSDLRVVQHRDRVRIYLNPEGHKLLEFTISGCYDPQNTPDA